MKERSCFKCFKKLDYTDFKHTNNKQSEPFLKKLWQSTHIEIFCCECYNVMGLEMRKRKKALREQLLNMRLKDRLKHVHGPDANLAEIMKIRGLDKF